MPEFLLPSFDSIYQGTVGKNPEQLTTSPPYKFLWNCLYHLEKFFEEYCKAFPKKCSIKSIRDAFKHPGVS